MGDQQPTRNTREDHLPGLSLIGANPYVLASHQAAPCLSVSIVAPPSCPAPMGLVDQALSPLTLKQNPAYVSLRGETVSAEVSRASPYKSRHGFMEPGYT